MITKNQLIIQSLKDAIKWHKDILSIYGENYTDEMWLKDIQNSKEWIDRYNKLLNKMKEK